MEKNNSNIVESSKTLYLRAFEISDLDYLIELRRNSDIFSLTAGNSYFSSSEHTKKMLNDNLFSDGNRLYLIICKASDNMPIGYLSIIEIDHINKRSQWGGVIIDPKFSGNGYGTLAGLEMLTFLFFQLNMNKVYGYWLSSNTASLKMALKLGFKEDGVLRSHVFKNNIYNDVLILSILKDEFTPKVK
jgi:diamine N-acetyltransferase